MPQKPVRPTNSTGNEPADKDPYAEGVEAAHRGQTLAHCPYQYGTKDGDDWVKGFTDTRPED